MASNGRRNGGSRRSGRSRVGRPEGTPGRRVSKSGRAAGRARKGTGTLIVIGGHEDKEGDKLILREVANCAAGGKLVVSTVASSVPDEMWATYEPIFRNLGCRHVWHLDIGSREEAMAERAIRVLDDATVVFFTGGDQLKITSQIGDTPVYERLREIYEAGGTVAGTSAGASVMCETMLVSGDGSESHKVGGALKMAPGLGFIDSIIIDQHFAERGRIGRLVAAVAQNPRSLGLGIDENTAVVVPAQRHLHVLGEGAVYVVDGRHISYSNLAEESADRTMSVFGLKLHLLSQGDRFEIEPRVPRGHAAETVERAVMAADA